MPQLFNDNLFQTANSFLVSIEDLRGGMKRSVATVADLEIYQTTDSNIALDQGMLAYVQGGTAADTEDATGFWFYDETAAGGVAQENDWGWVRFETVLGDGWRWFGP